MKKQKLWLVAGILSCLSVLYSAFMVFYHVITLIHFSNPYVYKVLLLNVVYSIVFGLLLYILYTVYFFGNYLNRKMRPLLLTICILHISNALIGIVTRLINETVTNPVIDLLISILTILVFASLLLLLLKPGRPTAMLLSILLLCQFVVGAIYDLYYFNLFSEMAKSFSHASDPLVVHSLGILHSYFIFLPIKFILWYKLALPHLCKQPLYEEPNIQAE